MENVLKPLDKSVLIPLGLTTAALATDEAIHKKTLRSRFTTLIFSNEEMEDIMKIVKALEDSALSIKSVKGGFIRMLLGTLGASLLGNLLTGKGTIRSSERNVRTG